MTHLLIVAARFYKDISNELEKGAISAIESERFTYDLIHVPGAFEIPAAISFAVRTKKYDGYIALGCVIRGETSHYDYVCKESSRGISQLAIDKNIAVGYGILTVENKEQAWQRASVEKGNKGAFAANTCMEMIKIKQQLRI